MEKNSKTIVVDLTENYNFVVDTFLWQIIYDLQFVFEDLKFWKPKFSNYLGWKIDQNQSYRSPWDYNFVVNEFFIWNHLRSQKYGWSFDDLKFKFVERLRMVKWQKSKL
jgi:hypothetical protein